MTFLKFLATVEYSYVNKDKIQTLRFVIIIRYFFSVSFRFFFFSVFNPFPYFYFHFFKSEKAEAEKTIQPLVTY